MDHGRALPGVDLLEVSYEAMVGNFDNQARRLVDYLGLPWAQRCLVFHTLSRTVATTSRAQVRHPIYSSSVSRWRHYQSGLIPLVDALGINGCDELEPVAGMGAKPGHPE